MEPHNIIDGGRVWPRRDSVKRLGGTSRRERPRQSASKPSSICRSAPAPRSARRQPRPAARVDRDARGEHPTGSPLLSPCGNHYRVTLPVAILGALTTACAPADWIVRRSSADPAAAARAWWFVTLAGA